MNLLKLLGLTGIIPSPITVYILLGAMAASAAGGGWVVYKFWQASEVTAVNEARAAEHDAVLLGNDHSKGVLDRARDRKAKNEKTIRDLRRRLAAQPGCTVAVPGEWLRGDESLPGAAGNTRRARPADAPVDPVADARDVVLTCELNRTDVYQPEADERAAIRAWYNDLRRRLNR